MMSRRMLYVAAENDPLHLHALRNRFLRTPNVAVQRIDMEAPEDLRGLENCFDTVLCLDLLEDVENPDQVLESLAGTLKPGGRMVVVTPNLPGLFGTLDQRLGHKRRYTAASLRALLEAHGLAVGRTESFNKVSLIAWAAYSRMIGAGNISKLVLKLFDKSVWLLRRLDVVIPWPGLTLIAVASKSAPADAPRSVERPEIARNAN
jgi:SAM-dependent methyltransferase